MHEMDEIPARLLQTILQSIADGIIVRDTTGKLVFANETAARMTGYSSTEEYLAAPPDEVFDRFELLDDGDEPLPRQQLPGQIALAGQGSSERVIHYRLRTTGEERWSLVAATPIADDAGNVKLIVSSFRDVTATMQAQRTAEAAAVRQAFVAEASHRLASSLDYETTLAAVAHLAVPRIADWCTVDIQEEDGRVRRLAVAHVDPAKVAYAEELARRFPVEDYPPRALLTGEAELYSEITDELLVERSSSEEMLRILRELGLRSAMTVPLVARGRTLGVISFVSAESGRHYTTDDLIFAEELASQAALAVDNARLYRDLDKRVQERTRELEAQLAVTREQVRLLDLAPDAILVCDFDTRSILFWSHGAELLYGWTKAEAYGENPHELLQTQFPESLDAVVNELLRAGRWEGQLIHTRKDGTQVTVASRWVLQRDSQGNPVSFLEVNTDLEPQRRAEEERAAREAAEAVAARTALLAESSRVIAEAGLEVHSMLAAIANWVAEAIGDSCVIRMLSDDGTTLERVAVAHRDPELRQLLSQMTERIAHRADDRPINTVIQTGASLRVTVRDSEQLRATLPPEHHLYLDRFTPNSLLYVPLRSHGNVIGVMIATRSGTPRSFTAEDEVLLQSVADRAALAIENARLYQQTTQALELRNEFLAVAAHELKTPLTGLRLSAELLLRRLRTQRPSSPASYEELINRIYEQTGKLSRLVNELLDVSRIESGRLELNPREVDLVELLHSAVDATSRGDDQVQIVVQAPARCTAVVDPFRTEQVLINLMDNARKFNPPGGAVEVALTQPAPDTVVITVRDHGPGIAEEHRAHIFERFYQAAPSRSTAGLGLGLFISRQIVELHGGELSAEFPPDGGACFVIRLPVAEAGYSSSAP